MKAAPVIAYTTQEVSVTIPAHAKGEMLYNLSEFNKKIARNGVEPGRVISFSDAKFTSIFGEEETAEVVTCLLTIPFLALGDYEFLAKKEYLDKDNFTIFGASEVPQRFREIGAVCEHCQSDRYRRELYIIRNSKTGDLVQVGSSCLSKFIPDYKLVTPWFKRISELIQAGEESEKEGARTVAYVGSFISAAVALISAEGFKKKDCDFDDVPTCSTLLRDFFIDNCPTFCEDKELVESVKEEMLKLNENSAAIVRAGFVEKKNFPFLSAQVYIALLNALRAKNVKAQGFYGETGSREELTLEFLGQAGYATRYGFVNVYKLKNSEGNLFVWKTTTCAAFRKGEFYKVTATISEHKEFRGEEQTIISNCRVAKN